MNDDFTDLFNFDDAFDFGASDLDLDFGEGFIQHKDLFDILNEGKSLNHAFMKAKVLGHDIKWSYIVVRNNRCIKRFCFLPKVFLFGM